MLPTTWLEFENRKFRAPANPKYFLEEYYGDYMQLPPINERYGHRPAYISFDSSVIKDN